MWIVRNLIATLLAGFIAVPAGAVELLMVEERGCAWCARWNAEIGPIYPKTDEGILAPLRRVDIRDMSDAGVEFDSRPVFTPTFVLVDNGRELGRIEGYPGEDFFWGMLGLLLEKLPDRTGPDTEEPS